VKLLVTGAGGLLGSEFRRRLSAMGHAALATTHAQLDVTDRRAVELAVRGARPDAVVHCAARARVDPAEAEAEETFRVNRDGARIVAETAAAEGARVVYMSTDYVFDGMERTPYGPDHPRAPLSVYARSKAEGEDAVRAVATGSLVVRVSWLFGGEGEGFVQHVLRQARAGLPIRVVRDHWSRPTWTANVVQIVVELLERNAPGGVWHVADAGEATRLDQAHEVLRIAGLSTEVVEMERDTLWPDVPRPAYSVLDTSATESFLGRPMEPWRSSLRRYLRESGHGAPPLPPR
jgi:dTDP-4-dehydrorhamnose reductase